MKPEPRRHSTRHGGLCRRDIQLSIMSRRDLVRTTVQNAVTALERLEGKVASIVHRSGLQGSAARSTHGEAAVDLDAGSLHPLPHMPNGSRTFLRVAGSVHCAMNVRVALAVSRPQGPGQAVSNTRRSFWFQCHRRQHLVGKSGHRSPPPVADLKAGSAWQLIAV